MALKPRLARPDYTISPEKEYLQRLGEILHFSLSFILKFQHHLKQPEIKDIISRALLLFPHQRENLEQLRSEAEVILNNILGSSAFEELLELIKEAKEIYSEVEIYSSYENRVYRPDLLIIKDDLLILLEFKLREEDFSKDQIEGYISLLTELFPKTRIHAYLVALKPFTLKLYNKIEAERDIHGTKGLSYTSQLSLFKELS